MGIRADHELSRSDKPFFRKQGMLHAHFPHVEEMLDIPGKGKLPYALALFRRLYILIGRKMVEHKRYFAFIENRIDTGFF